ncbi:hypothetical protein HY490_01350 [Candidatus Woesearchaeota archaeon]|nr:hypothetical protein [Candidatus Woesearchaeota archaeon]
MILIISTCADTLSELEFVRPIEKIVGACTTKHHKKLTHKDIHAATKIILTGTALADFEYLIHDFSWLREITVPVLGICAGMQIIAKEFELPLVDTKNIGVRQVQVVEKNKLADSTFNAYFLHTKTGTGNFHVLAKSEGTPCMIKHPSKEIYGCIFHPEVMNQRIITNFIENFE